MKLFFTNRILTKQQQGWLMLGLLVFIWGTSFILIKRGLEVYSPFEVGAIRVSVSFLVLLPFALMRLRLVPRAKLKYIIIIGVVGTGLPAFLFAQAQTHIDSSLAGILNSLTPLFTMLLGILFFSQRLSWLRLMGVLLGLTGAVGLVYVTSEGAMEFHFSYAVYAIIATILYAIQSNMIKYYLDDVPALSIASLGFFFVGIPVLILLLFFTDFRQTLLHHEHGLSAFAYIAVLGIFASSIAIIIYNKLIQTTNAVFASSVTYFVPVLALIWGVFDGERFPALALIFTAIILMGVFLVNKKSTKTIC
jgi:drug/metabolite transporter (DMT)-like permease